MESNISSRKFGSFEDLSNTTKRKIEIVMSALDEKKYTYSIYYGYPIIDEKNKKDFVKGIIISEKGIIILYENQEEINIYKTRIYQLISQDASLFGAVVPIPNFIMEYNLDDLENILGKFENDPDIFSSEIISKVTRAIQMAYGLTNEDERELNASTSLGAKIKKRNTFIGAYDEEQFNMIHAHQNENIRVRGLAGSGKTILMAKKMAYLHYKDRDKKMAFVFYTISLRQTILRLFKQYYNDYDRYGEPDFSKIDIFHSWGGIYKKGFYAEIAQYSNRPLYTLGDAQIKKDFKEDPYEFVCRDILENVNDENLDLYDYVFIDEAQDFKINFFKMARKSLKKDGKLIYAYDELQSLNEDNSIPSKSEIFGSDECIDINLKTSYRAPVQVLTVAHALGLGMHRETNGQGLSFVNMIKDKSVWTDVGYYVVNGELEYGKYVELERKEEKVQDKCIVNTEICKSVTEQYEKLSIEIINLIKYEDILPEDILIIDLETRQVNNNHATFRKIFNSLARRENFVKNEKVAASINLINKDNPNVVKIKDAIPYTTIFRAKGNEANIVFIVNTDTLQMIQSVTRNKIFTAMTRARYAVWLMGTEDIEAYRKEIEIVENNDYMLKFNYPSEQELEEIKTYGEIDSKNQVKFESAERHLEDLMNSNPELAKYLLQQMQSKFDGLGE
ncbi:DEAD/DEAH box helicase [Bacillus paramycoides]|uniref:DEAD/DEAH box helicase n=1 Tax=Bacillus paramycoides TaxID=2026194 RepID=UPI003D0240F0